ncbi:hypothetical protein TNCV_2262231 [Trichonephila clavipes]|nr:hypothetical protein TNCV_2262231 [Trichonephila clavipes]
MRYRDETLEPYVRIFGGAVGPDFVLMYDKVRPQRAHLVSEFLERYSMDSLANQISRPHSYRVEVFNR